MRRDVVDHEEEETGQIDPEKRIDRQQQPPTRHPGGQIAEQRRDKHQGRESRGHHPG